MSLENAPEHFICPLTLEVMTHPLQHKFTKHNFERKAIMEWIFFGKATCPLTRTTLHPQDFVENEALVQEISQWKEDNQVAEEEQEDLDASFLLDLDSLADAAVSKRNPKKKEGQPKRDPSKALRSRIMEKREARLTAATA